MRVAKKTSISPNADRELDDETFMSAEQLRGYMNALMAAKWNLGERGCHERC